MSGALNTCIKLLLRHVDTPEIGITKSSINIVTMQNNPTFRLFGLSNILGYWLIDCRDVVRKNAFNLREYGKIMGSLFDLFFKGNSLERSYLLSFFS